MNPTVTAITLGVEDVTRSQRFYEVGLGCTPIQQTEGFAAFGLPGVSSTIAVYAWDALATDAGVAPQGNGFRAAAVSFIVDTAEAVDTVMTSARTAGATVVKPARSQLWGGYSGYLADPDGHLWKVASNHRPPMFRGRRAAAAPVAPVAPVAPPPPTETAITLACHDLKQSKVFYADGLGFQVDKSFGKFASFKAEDGATQLSLYTWDALAEDAGVDAEGHGFRAITLSYVAASPDEVDEVLAAAAKALGE